MYILLWLVLCVLVTIFAANKGRNWALAFVASLILSPLVGFIIVAVLKNKKAAAEADQRQKELISAVKGANDSGGDIRACPHCAETIKQAALVCRFCNRDVQPAPLPAA